MRTHIFNVSAILSVDNIKIQMSFFLILFFLPSLNWERERESIQWQYLGRVEGENGFMVYLAFWWRVSSESIFFNRLVGFYRARLEASAISCPRALFCFFTRSFGHSVHTSCHTNCYPKNWFLYPYFRWRKGCYFRFRVLANHLASFFFLHRVRRFVRTTISSTRVRLRHTNSLTYILFFLQQAGRSWPTF